VKRVLVALVSILAAVHVGAEVVTVFGLPLGGRPAKPYTICRQVGTHEAQPCWIEAPSRSKEGVRGVVTLPDKVLPVWAQFAVTDLSLDPKGVIENLGFRFIFGCDFSAMRTSVGARFGAPTTERNAIGHTYEWDLPEIFIQVTEYDGRALKGCSASFRTPASMQQQRRERERIREQDAARPRTP
jgi:hypothetical protein